MPSAQGWPLSHFPHSSALSPSGCWDEELWAPGAVHTVGSPSWATEVSGTHQGQGNRARAEAATAARAIARGRQGMQLKWAAGRGRTPRLRPVPLCCCRSSASLSQLIALRRPHRPQTANLCPAAAGDSGDKISPWLQPGSGCCARDGARGRVGGGRAEGAAFRGLSPALPTPAAVAPSRGRRCQKGCGKGWR